MILVLAIVVACCAVFAYVPLTLVVVHRKQPERRRPVDQVLSEAVAEGRLSMERFERMMDEVHHSMPTLDAPYPLVRDVTE